MILASGKGARLHGMFRAHGPLASKKGAAAATPFLIFPNRRRCLVVTLEEGRQVIRIAALFKQAPEEFLRMIVVHELAHLREREHDKAFYQLCQHMEPHYHQYELDVRLYLTHMESSGERLWDA